MTRDRNLNYVEEQVQTVVIRNDSRGNFIITGVETAGGGQMYLTPGASAEIRMVNRLRGDQEMRVLDFRLEAQVQDVCAMPMSRLAALQQRIEGEIQRRRNTRADRRGGINFVAEDEMLDMPSYWVPPPSTAKPERIRKPKPVPIAAEEEKQQMRRILDLE